jgi:hypothetical protein
VRTRTFTARFRRLGRITSYYSGTRHSKQLWVAVGSRNIGVKLLFLEIQLSYPHFTPRRFSVTLHTSLRYELTSSDLEDSSGRRAAKQFLQEHKSSGTRDKSSGSSASSTLPRPSLLTSKQQDSMIGNRVQRLFLSDSPGPKDKEQSSHLVIPLFRGRKTG